MELSVLKEAIGQRLREERKRAGLTLPDFGQVGGVQKNAQLAYEAGERTPDAGYLAQVEAELGVDVLFVLTGRRERKLDALSTRERELLDRFTQLPEKHKEHVETSLLLAYMAYQDRRAVHDEVDGSAAPVKPVRKSKLA